MMWQNKRDKIRGKSPSNGKKNNSVTDPLVGNGASNGRYSMRSTTEDQFFDDGPIRSDSEEKKGSDERMD